MISPYTFDANQFMTMATVASIIKVPIRIGQSEILGSIEIGTPPQCFEVLFHQGFQDFWVANEEVVEKEGLVPPKEGFKFRKSTIFHEENEPYSESYFRAEGVIGEDWVTIGQKRFKTKFGIVKNYISFENGIRVANGMFGISIAPPKETLKIKRADRALRALDLLPNLERKIYTIWTSHLVSILPHVHGQITFGGEDSQHCKPDFTYIPLQSAQLGRAKLESIKIGEHKWELARNDQQMTFPTIQKDGSYKREREGISGPLKEVRAMGEVLGVKWASEGDQDMGEIACPRMFGKRLPNIVLTFGGNDPDSGENVGNSVDWVLTPEDYIIKHQPFFGKCYFLFYSHGENYSWSVLPLMMNRWCTAYDFEHQSIGFGHKKFLGF